MSTSLSSGLVGVSHQIIFVFGWTAASSAADVVEIDEAEIEARRAPAHALEQAIGAAVDVVHADHVAAAVEQLEHRGGGGQAGGEGVAVAAALERGDAALVGEAGRVVAARIFEALVHARAALHVGGGRVDRRHHRAGARVGRLAGVDRQGAEAVGVVFVGVMLESAGYCARRRR